MFYTIYINTIVLRLYKGGKFPFQVDTRLDEGNQYPGYSKFLAIIWIQMWCYISKNGVKCIYSVHVEKPKNIKFGVIPTSHQEIQRMRKMYMYTGFSR